MNQAHRTHGSHLLRRIRILTLIGALLSWVPGGYSQGPVGNDKNIEAVGVPPIPASLAKEVEPYKGLYGLPLAGWNPTRREIWLKGLSSVTWVSRIITPGFMPIPSMYIRQGGIYDVYFQPQGKYLADTRDAAGNEMFHLYLYDMGSGNTTLLSDGKSRSTEPVWSNAGNKIVYSSTPASGTGVNLRILDRLDPKADRPLVQSSGTYLKAYDWSPDDKQIVFCDFSSNTTATVWLADATSGNKTLLSPKGDQAEFYDSPQFSKDGKGVYVVTDHDSDMRRIAYIELANRKMSYVPSDPKWDVDEFQLSPDGKTLAYITNEDGISRLHLLDLVAGKERSTPQLPIGIISDLKWNKDSTEVAFNFKSPQTPNDVYSVNSQTGKAELWAKSITKGVDTSQFAQAELIHWPTFDSRTVSGFLVSSANQVYRQASRDHRHSRWPRRAIPSNVQLRGELFPKCVGRRKALSERPGVNRLWQDVRTP